MESWLRNAAFSALQKNILPSSFWLDKYFSNQIDFNWLGLQFRNLFVVPPAVPSSSSRECANFTISNRSHNFRTEELPIVNTGNGGAHQLSQHTSAWLFKVLHNHQVNARGHAANLISTFSHATRAFSIRPHNIMSRPTKALLSFNTALICSASGYTPTHKEKPSRVGRLFQHT